MPTTAEPTETDDPRVNPCPECDDGEVITTGFRNPAATQAYCSAACGWTA